MDLIRAWAAAAVVFLVGSVALVAITANTSSADAVTGTDGSALWNGAATLMIFLLTAAAGAIVHPEPRRADPVRHAVAVLTVPAVTMMANVALIMGGHYSVAASVASIIGGLIGAVAGWRIVGWLRSRTS